MRHSLRLAVVGVLAVMVSGISFLGSNAGAATRPYCGITWAHATRRPAARPTP